jgi:hypothetical protein
VKIAIDNQEDIEHLKNSKVNLEVKTKEFFGRKVDLIFSTDSNSTYTKNIQSAPKDNPLINAVIEQLGGREVS